MPFHRSGVKRKVGPLPTRSRTSATAIAHFDQFND